MFLHLSKEAVYSLHMFSYCYVRNHYELDKCDIVVCDSYIYARSCFDYCR